MSLRSIVFKKIVYLFIFISCGSGTFRVISETDSNKVLITDFGAVPNDGKDDSDAIQRAIDFAIQSDESSVIYCPPGIYDLSKGVVLARQNTNGEYAHITITLSGHVPTYSANQKIGSTTVFRLSSKSFAVAIQKARNAVIENIVFEGISQYSNKPNEILYEDANLNGKSRTNQYSPSCAIAIDPFAQSISKKNRYNFHESRYGNQSRGGTSMLLIRGCSFLNHYIAIANNSSGFIRNGDNIRAEQCHVTRCHTFWSAGQSQSRGNSIDNVYATHINTFVSGVQIGSQNGTPPTISNLNLAGFCKKFLHLQTGFSGVNIYRSYLEYVWSLGIAEVNSVSFDQCHIKFSKPSDKFFMPPLHLRSSRCVVSFRDCNIEFFDNCKTPMPIIFQSASLILSGGSIEGGVVVSDGYTNAGGDDLHKVTYDNVFIKCLGKVAGTKNSKIPKSKLENSILMGGEIASGLDNSLYLNSGATFNHKYVEMVKITIQKEDVSLTFKSSNPEAYKIGDNLFTTTPIDLTFMDVKGYVKPTLGFVKSIQGNKITVEGIPFGIKEGKHHIYMVSFPILRTNTRSRGNKIDKYILEK